MTLKVCFPVESPRVTKRRGVLLSAGSPTLAITGRKFYRQIPQPLIPPLAFQGGVFTQLTQQLKEGFTQAKASPVTHPTTWGRNLGCSPTLEMWKPRLRRVHLVLIPAVRKRRWALRPFSSQAQLSNHPTALPSFQRHDLDVHRCSKSNSSCLASDVAGRQLIIMHGLSTLLTQFFSVLVTYKATVDWRSGLLLPRIPTTIPQGGHLLVCQTLWLPGTESHSHPSGEKEWGGVGLGQGWRCLGASMWFPSLLQLFSVFPRVSLLSAHLCKASSLLAPDLSSSCGPAALTPLDRTFQCIPVASSPAANCLHVSAFLGSNSWGGNLIGPAPFLCWAVGHRSPAGLSWLRWLPLLYGTAQRGTQPCWGMYLPLSARAIGWIVPLWRTMANICNILLKPPLALRQE